MYRGVYFLKEWGVSCATCTVQHGRMGRRPRGNTLPSGNPGAFHTPWSQAFYGPLGSATVPKLQRHSPENGVCRAMPPSCRLEEKMERKLDTVFGIAASAISPSGAALPPPSSRRKPNGRPNASARRSHASVTIQPKRADKFKSRTTLVPAFATRSAPALFWAGPHHLRRGRLVCTRHAMQACRLRMSLQHEPTTWIPSPTAELADACFICRSWQIRWWRSAIGLQVARKRALLLHSATACLCFGQDGQPIQAEGEHAAHATPA